MNRLVLVTLISSCLLILTGCNFKESKTKTGNNNGFGSSHAPTIIVDNTQDDTADNTVNDDDKSDGTTDSTVSDDDKKDEAVGDTGDTGDTGVTIDSIDLVDCVATPSPIKKFTRVQMTYGLLEDGAFIFGESGGLLPITITTPAAQGATEISVNSTVSLVDEQLLSYLGTNGNYSVAQIQSTTADKITLEKPLLYDLAADDASLWNFYDDAVHANESGFKAIADFAFNAAVSDPFNTINPDSVHLLLGDSWFNRNGETALAGRLLERLPSGSIIKNEGIGGYSLCGLLGSYDEDADEYSRVDATILANNPSYVWISSSINDSFDGVTQEEYKARMQTLIGRVQALGAYAIVFDPAPGIIGQSTDDGISFTTLSQRYATQILDLLADAAEPEE